MKSEVKAAATQVAADAQQFASDVTFTAGVNAALAKAPGLRAVRIDVDSHDGCVVLGGVAPAAAAKGRVTQIATAVRAWRRSTTE